MKDDKIKESLNSKKFKIINVIKNINYKFDDFGNQIDFVEIMEKEDIAKFFDELDKILLDTDDLCFVIFQEYFFSYHLVIEEEKSELILSLTKEITKKNKIQYLLLIYYINLKNLNQLKIMKKKLKHI